MEEDKTVLVTSGATVTFKQLIILSLSKLVLQKFQQYGYNKIVIQFGNSARDLYLNCLKRLDCEYDETEVGDKLTIVANYEGLILEGINFDKDLTSNYTQHASLVISHGGSGSILDSLRLGKKLIVLNNDELSEGHQLDIINEFLNKNHLVYCDDNYDNEVLCKCIDKAITTDLDPIQQSNGKIIQKIIIQSLT